VKPVAVLFVNRSSHYWHAPGVECFDVKRNALTFAGGVPVVAHPPCRSWGRLRAFAKPREGERELALWALDVVRREGGVLEHPNGSALWREPGMPGAHGVRDRWGGWTMTVSQAWFGHRAPKLTGLYVVGCAPRDLPPYPLILGQAPGRVSRMGKAERERTPEEFGEWLIAVARATHGASTADRR
jgi:hypothetical protein